MTLTSYHEKIREIYMWETLYVVVNMLAMFVSFACCADMGMEKPSVNQKYLMLICICGFITTVGNAMEVFAYTEEVAIAAIKVAYIGKCYIMLFSLLFVGNYCRVRLPKLLIGFHGIAK